MGKIRETPLAALIAGIAFAGEDNRDRAVELLVREFGPVEMESPVFDFIMTDYYTAEMGEHLKKQFLCFASPINLINLPDIKLFTNEIESRFTQVDSGNHKRTVNIDSGYVTLSKLVLASTKNYSHRIFIGKDIYAEITLTFLKDTFKCLETTYPDYKTSLAVEFFNAVREFVKRNRSQWTRKKE